jgi:predicted P-loop ATPase
MRRLSVLAPVDLFRDVISDIAWQHRFHPVKDYLDGIEPQWDGVARIGSWVTDYGGAKDTELNRAFGRLWMIAAVRRIRHPGCKCDTMIVLESPQGKDKSKALRALAVKDEWFTDNLDLGADAKVVMEIMAGKWIVEFSELDGMGRREISRIKNFLSKQDDRARMAYGHFPQTHQRQFVCAGTTNEHQYLLDEENRRFLPIEIACFDTEALIRDRDQLWPEAAHYECLGEPITLDKSLWGAAAEIQADREIENPFLDILRNLLGVQDGWITILKLWEILGIELDQRQKNGRLIGKAMRKLGFKRERVCDRTGLSPKGKRHSVYYIRGKDEPLPMQAVDPEWEKARKEKCADEERQKLQESANEALRKNPFTH